MTANKTTPRQGKTATESNDDMTELERRILEFYDVGGLSFLDAETIVYNLDLEYSTEMVQAALEDLQHKKEITAHPPVYERTGDD